MAACIRLSRHGSKKRPFYRIVAANSEAPRDGRYLEQLGYYDPTKEPVVLKVHLDKLEGWMRNGARPSDTVARLIRKAGWKGLPSASKAESTAGAQS